MPSDGRANLPMSCTLANLWTHTSAEPRYCALERAFALSGPWELQATTVAADDTSQTRILVDRPGASAFYRIVALP